MIATNSPLTQTEQEVNRRQVLVMIYKLLIRLAEESENQTVLLELISKEEQKIEKPALAGTDPIMEEAYSFAEPELSILSTEQTNNSVP